MIEIEKKVLSSLNKKFNMAKEENRLAKSKQLAKDLFSWHSEGGPDLIKTKMEEILRGMKDKFNTEFENLEEGVE